MYTVLAVNDVDPDRDVYVALPVEQTVPGTKQVYHRLHIRSTQTQYDNAVVQRADGASNVVQSSRGLSRLLLRFPRVFVPGIRTHTGDGGRTQLSMGFSLNDGRNEELTAEERRLIGSVDNLSSWLRRTIVGHRRIRKTLGLGAVEMDAAQIAVVADMLELHISRPASDERRSRFVYPKLVAPEGRTGSHFSTIFWSPNGKRVPFKDVCALTASFYAEPCIEIEELFASKSVRSLQLRVRECIVHMPDGRANLRTSAMFSDKVVEEESESEGANADTDGVADADDALAGTEVAAEHVASAIATEPESKQAPQHSDVMEATDNTPGSETSAAAIPAAPEVAEDEPQTETAPPSPSSGQAITPPRREEAEVVTNVNVNHKRTHTGPQSSSKRGRQLTLG